MNIRQKFITSLLSIGLIPTLIVGIVSFITISNQLNQRTASQLASIDIKQQQAISSLLQTKQQDLIKLAEEYDFQIALQQYLTAKTAANQTAVVNILDSKLSTVSGLSVIHVADQNNTVIASTDPAQENQKLPGQGSPNGTYQGPDITIVSDPSSGLAELSITTSLTINNLYPATLREIFSVSNLEAALSDYTGLGSTGETVITEPSASGQQLALFPLRFNQSPVNVTPFSVSKNGAITNYKGRQVMVSSRPIGFSDWTISTMIDNKEALAPISDLGNALIVIFLASSLAITLLAWYLARIFTEPIRRIADASRRIGQGDFNVVVDVHASDEIGALARSV
jgi:methyl-accepting chemotaxis protein